MSNTVLDKYLNDLTLNDPQFKNYLQYILGMLYNGNRYNKLMQVLYGEGNECKSLLIKII
jgi:phage/plasmid-associated DNA primase